MGSLVPNASYAYETVNGVVYAILEGTTIKKEIGRYVTTEIDDDVLWKHIREESKNNIALHTALENAKIIYYLSKDNGS